jgi:hypothetical protein
MTGKDSFISLVIADYSTFVGLPQQLSDTKISICISDNKELYLNNSV